MATFFADTNFFIQCRNAETLPWPEITEDADVVIIISMAVQKELDRFKQDGNGRRAKRARSLNPLFREMVSSEGMEKVIKTKNPQVTIRLASPLDLHLINDNRLDLTQADDRVLSEILAYNNDFPTERANLLTNDINMMVKARHFKIPFVEIPETWLLEAEPDEKDKKLKELERRVSALEEEQPDACIQTVSDNRDLLSHLAIEIIEYEPLQYSVITSILEEVQLVFPMVTDFSKPNFLDITRQYIPPSQREIEEYQNEKYPAWIGQLDQYLRSVPSILEAEARQFDVKFLLTNDGSRPAENLILEFDAIGDIQFQLLSDENMDVSTLKNFPQPPQAPEGVVKSLMDIGFQSLSEMMGPRMPPRLFNPPLHPPKRNRYEFYWKDGRPSPLDKSWAYTCDEFRHQRDAEPFVVSGLITAGVDIQADCGIRCRVSASNQSQPCIVTLPLSIKRVKRNPADDVRAAVLTTIKTLRLKK